MMRPMENPYATRVLRGPQSSEIVDLPVVDDTVTVDGREIPIMTSYWVPTESEREAIAQGRPIRLTIGGRSHPPVALDVSAPKTEEATPDASPETHAQS